MAPPEAGNLSGLLGENLSLFPEGFPSRFACGNDSAEARIDFEIGSSDFHCYLLSFSLVPRIVN
jgi:hypothetical protein